MDELDLLRDVIQRRHKMRCTHIRSERVREVLDDGTPWEGIVEVFACIDSQALLVYAWSYESAEGERRYVAVLGKPPVGSPREAVRAAARAHAGGDGAPSEADLL